MERHELLAIYKRALDYFLISEYGQSYTTGLCHALGVALKYKVITETVHWDFSMPNVKGHMHSEGLFKEIYAYKPEVLPIKGVTYWFMTDEQGHATRIKILEEVIAKLEEEIQKLEN